MSLPNSAIYQKNCKNCQDEKSKKWQLKKWEILVWKHKKWYQMMSNGLDERPAQAKLIHKMKKMAKMEEISFSKMNISKLPNF